MLLYNETLIYLTDKTKNVFEEVLQAACFKTLRYNVQRYKPIIII